jgi:hypothetical protein
MEGLGRDAEVLKSSSMILPLFSILRFVSCKQFFYVHIGLKQSPDRDIISCTISGVIKRFYFYSISPKGSLSP